VCLLELRFDSEKFSGVSASFFLGVVELTLEAVDLGLPFLYGLVESTLFLLKLVGVGVGLLKINKYISYIYISFVTK